MFYERRKKNTRVTSGGRRLHFKYFRHVEFILVRDWFAQIDRYNYRFICFSHFFRSLNLFFLFLILFVNFILFFFLSLFLLILSFFPSSFCLSWEISSIFRLFLQIRKRQCSNRYSSFRLPRSSGKQNKISNDNIKKLFF